MKNYIIAYHLTDFAYNYAEFYATIKKEYPEYQHIIEELWVIKTDDTAKEIVAKLRPTLQPKDPIFVSDLGEDREGWVARGFWKWINKEEKLKEDESD